MDIDYNDIPWTPRESDIEWTRNHIRTIKENGGWGLPISNNSIFIFHHSDKTYSLYDTSRNPTELMPLLQSMKVLGILGYQPRMVAKTTEEEYKQVLKNFANITGMDSRK